MRSWELVDLGLTGSLAIRMKSLGREKKLRAIELAGKGDWLRKPGSRERETLDPFRTQTLPGQGRPGLEPGPVLFLLLDWRKLPCLVCALAFSAGYTAPSDPRAI